MEAPESYIDPCLTQPDLLVLQNLLQDSKVPRDTSTDSNSQDDTKPDVPRRDVKSERQPGEVDEPIQDVQPTIDFLNAINNPNHKDFEPTVFVSWDLKNIKAPAFVKDYILEPYIRHARKVVRVETDVVMLTHLLLYFTTSVPSAILLYYHFTWLHAVAHCAMQAYYVGTYTLMMHQHIHMGGILAKKYWWIDALFPYITNPLMGHTWNSYYYHHVKHHHIEANGPGDLSTTIYYQRDDPLCFLQYVGRFFFLVWLELPLYFIRSGKTTIGLKAGGWEIASYVAMFLLGKLHLRATFFVFLLPLTLLRIALMVGNWGQHAFVDETDPNSDFRSSITLIDVTSNRFCYNDGYHTSHHLNPRRHWREHPVAFLKQKERFSTEHALVFRNIDYFMLTVKLLSKDYMHLAKCLVPIGDQVGMSLDQTADMLRTKTRRFTPEDVRKKFDQKNA